tara:strand:- start:14463 stop:14753 length:291 start_codon:yes stop_codon:yes gene_type:complete
LQCPLILVKQKNWGKSLYYFYVSEGEAEHLQVFVRDNNIDGALKALKKKMQREGVWREMKRHRSYEKPSERRVRKKAEAIRRSRKLERKRQQIEGF